MEIQPALQAALLLMAALGGVAVGFFRDLFSVVETLAFRKRRVGCVVRFLGDFLAVMSAGVLLVILNYYFNKGEIRGFSFFGLLTGFFVYAKTVSFYIKKALEAILRFFVRSVRFILRPIIKLLKILLVFLKKFLRYLLKALEKIKKMVYNIYVKKRILKRAEKGFFSEK